MLTLLGCWKRRKHKRRNENAGDFTGDITGCWFGLYRNITRDSWQYMDGSITDYGFHSNDGSDPTTSESPWDNDQPNNKGGDQNCVLMLYRGSGKFYWHDEECYTQSYPICTITDAYDNLPSTTHLAMTTDLAMITSTSTVPIRQTSSTYYFSTTNEITTNEITSNTDDTMESKSQGNSNDDLILYIILAAGCLLLCILLILIWRKFTKKKDGKMLSRGLSVCADHLTNPLVVIISIGEYEKDNKDCELPGVTMMDIPVEKDVNNLKLLFQMLKYTVIPEKMKLHWTQDEIITFLKKSGRKLFVDDECKELLHDGLIVIISSHGIEDHIVTSDYKAIQKKAIHRLFSMHYPKAREIPRIFMFDACDGNAERNISSLINIADKGKSFGMEELEMKEETALVNAWTDDNHNPDFKLVEIHAANSGFQAKLNTTFGSYLLYEFVSRMKKCIDDGEDVTLGRLFDKIQNELHDKGKQQIVKVFNNDTRGIQLQMRDDDIVKEYVVSPRIEMEILTVPSNDPDRMQLCSMRR